MPDYKTMYYTLFNSVTNAIKLVQEAQRETENEYIESEPVPLTVLSNKSEKNDTAE